MTGYRYLDHTADVGISAWGSTPEEALEAATTGILRLMFDPARVREGEERLVSASGEEIDDCIVNYFNEVLYLVEGEKWLAARLIELRRDERGIEARFSGEPFDPDRHSFDAEVKAATYHGFSLAEGSRGWELEVIFDV